MNSGASADSGEAEQKWSKFAEKANKGIMGLKKLTVLKQKELLRVKAGLRR